MFTEESQARANTLLTNYGAEYFVLQRDGTLGVMIAGNFHAVQGGQDVQIHLSDEEHAALAIEKARAQDEADLAEFRAQKKS